MCRAVSRGLAAPAKKKSKAAKQAANMDDHKDAAYEFYKSVIDAPKRTRPKLSEEERQQRKAERQHAKDLKRKEARANEVRRCEQARSGASASASANASANANAS